MLELGERIVIVKGDGTLLVHNPEGVKPVNWQPAGATFAVVAGEDSLVLAATRKKPPESVQIVFEEVLLLVSMALKDNAEFLLKGSEFDLRDLVAQNPTLLEPGFVPWARERASARGPMDIYGQDDRGRRVVVELKRTRAGIAEATQLWRYVERERASRTVDVRGILVAPAFSPRCLTMLKEHALESKVLDWDSALGRSAVEPAAQATLASFASVTTRRRSGASRSR
jgi:hypothetical protein